MIAIVDYGVGNLFSLKSSLKFLNIDAVVTSKKEDLIKANGIILPGVGAFGDAIKKLNDTGLTDTIIELAKGGKPLLGICLGMQLLFEKSYEYGEHKGLSLIDGEVRPLCEVVTDLKIPHMGWNSLDFKNATPLYKYISQGDYVYFVHSFYASTDFNNLSATSSYGIDVTASVQKGNVYGTQFHPEKSGETGLKILKAFAEISEEIC